MKRVLLQFDTDPLPSSFDRIVAVDAGIEEILSYGDVSTENVEPLVHGAMFTRGGDDLRCTALFIGGSIVSDGEALLKKVTETFFGPVRVSVMMDSNGSNTTAAAAVLSAARHLRLPEITAVVLGGTGPVGHRAAQLLAGQGAAVRVASRSLERARETCDAIARAVPGARLSAWESGTEQGRREILQGAALILAAGAAGVTLLTQAELQAAENLRVAIDVNAVPPAGIEGIDVTDKATERNGVICYGALGVGGLKMKIHRAALQRLFERNDLVLDTAAIFEVGQSLLA